MEKPGRLQSMGSLESDTTERLSRLTFMHWSLESDTTERLSRLTFMHWRRKWKPTPVFLPGESQGWGSLVGCRLWGRTGSDTTEATCSSSTHIKRKDSYQHPKNMGSLGPAASPSGFWTGPVSSVLRTWASVSLCPWWLLDMSSMDSDLIIWAKVKRDLLPGPAP